MKFPLPDGRVAVVPSVLSADFTRLGAELRRVRPHSDWVQLDVMDGRFVPNISFGPHVGAAVARASGLPVDSHLMVERPNRLVDAFAASGSGLITVHYESLGALSAIRKIKALGLKAGLAVKPATPLAGPLRLLPLLDLFLVMTVEPGFGGQKFIRAMLPRVKAVRAAITKSGRPVWLQVDGGINADTAPLAVKAGADSLVAGSALFSAVNLVEFTRALKGSRGGR
ncbi:MAG: ribulose-phosphate 3-epimerase [Elusimicrobiales bacterium]|jgi:ribulose-phosphate 3-epimerase|nr:ribulose-phosphate 3-epimerase [Elusimicrobiales bacterium]